MEDLMDTLKSQSDGIKFIHAYMECTNDIQQLVKELIYDVILSDDSDADEKHMAIFSVADALFPNPYKGLHGMDLAESEFDAASRDPELAKIVADMNAEELSFSERLRSLMDEKGITQQSFVATVRLGSFAIPNIISRHGLPPRRSGQKIYQPFGVEQPAYFPWYSNLRYYVQT